MKKGAWILNLVARVVRGDLSFSEAWAFGSARVRRKPVSFCLHGLKFEDVDGVFWGVIADVFINQVYLPSNFSIHPNGVVVDIGAHRGGFTSFSAINTQAKVLAFEPHPDNFRALKKLIKTNNLNNVSVHNAAVGARTGKSRLFLSTASSRHSLFEYEAGAMTKLSNSVEIALLSLDDCLKDIDQVDLLKMDCEGAEHEILMNASEESLSKINKLTVEIHDPVDSVKIKELRERLVRYFPQIRLVKQSNERYGYLYANH